jgi:hypothetical protein
MTAFGFLKKKSPGLEEKEHGDRGTLPKVSRETMAGF